MVPVADDADLLGIRSPHGERDSVVDDVRTELRVELLVPARADEVEVELTQARAAAQNAVSKSRKIPATGIGTQSGRLSSS